MILAMSRVRVLGPRERMDQVLTAIQDLGLVHIIRPHLHDLVHEVNLTPREQRERDWVVKLLGDIDRIKTLLGIKLASPVVAPPRATRSDLATWIRRINRWRGRLEHLAQRRHEIEEERSLIEKYREFFTVFGSFVEATAITDAMRAYHVILRVGADDLVASLRKRLGDLIDGEFELATRVLSSGETAALLLVSNTAAERVETVLSKAGVRELPVPEEYGATTLADALPRMRKRLEEIPRELAVIDRERRTIQASSRQTLEQALTAANDRLLEFDAMTKVGETAHAFVIEGWMPRSTVPQLRTALAEMGQDIVVAEDRQEDWSTEMVPVVLSNARLFRPFETITRMLPLPRYGSIDPTPFVAVMANTRA